MPPSNVQAVTSTTPVSAALTRNTWATGDPLLTEYYDTEWGVPVRDERGLFERVSLEAFQSGLSWLTILRKRDAFRSAFAGFDPEIVAQFGEEDVARLLNNPEIIRNERKIRATISNAAAVLRLRDEGGLSKLVWAAQPERTPMPLRSEDVPARTPESSALAAQLKSHGFKFVGPTTAHALMEAVGIIDTHIVSSHRRGCSGLWNADGSRKE